MKNNTKHILQWVLALVIALAVPNVANAQFGGLKKAVKNATKSTVKEKTRSDVPDYYKKKSQTTTTTTTTEKEEKTTTTTTVDDDPYGPGQIEALNKRKAEYAAEQQRAQEAREKAGCKIIESRRDNLIGSWHSKKNMLMTSKQHESGAAQGKFVTYTADYDKNVILCNDGTVAATFTDDGVDIPSINAKVAVKNGALKINGESVGNVTTQDIHLYGRRLGYFSCEATRALVAFFFLTQTPFGTPEMRANMKRTQFMDGNFMNASGSRIGYIKAGAIYNIDKLYPKLGNLHYSDDETVIADNKFRVGALQYDGTVNDNDGNKIGQVKENGDILNAAGTRVAHVSNDGKVTDKSGKLLVQFSGDRPIAAAVAYYFFFRERIK